MTKHKDDNDSPLSLASSPCSMHEVDPAYMGLETQKGKHGLPDDHELACLKDALLRADLKLPG